MPERRHYRTSPHRAPPETMSTARPPEATAAPVDLAETPALEAALSRRIGPLRFAPALEQAYHRDTGAARTARIAACNALGGMFYVANTMLTADRIAPIVPAMEPMRLGTVLFILVAAAILFWRRRTIPAWVAETVTSSGALLIAAYALMAAHYPSDDLAVVIQTGSLFTLFLHAGLAARQQFRYTFCTGAVVLTGYVLAARSHNDAQAAIVSGNALLMATTFAFTLLANYVLEYRERRAYVLQSLEAHHRRALADSAEALRRLSLTDALTGLANRRAFDAEFHLAWDAAAAASQPLAVLQIDIDFFKRYNDHYGHPVGDLCLQRVAQALQAVAMQHGGLAARTGGEEFVLLLPHHTLDAAMGIGDALRLAVRALALSHADSPVAPCVTVSVGAAATVPDGAQQAPDLLRAGDGALYDAKRAGRDRVARGPASAGHRSTLHSMPAPLPPPTDDLPTTEPDPDPESSAMAQRIDLLTRVLRSGLRRLGFPAALEAAYQGSLEAARARWLPALGVGGLLYTVLYVHLSRPLLVDVADAMLHTVLVVSGTILPVLIWIGRPLVSPWWRETLFSGSAVALHLGITLPLTGSKHIMVYSYALALFLVPMFSSVIAAQPFRHSLATSLLALGATVACLYPSRPDWVSLWAAVSVMLLTGAALSSVGGYLIDLSTRRNYLLGQLDDAQRALLTGNAQRLRQLADADPLTGLANRRRFDAELAALTQACAAQGRPLALLIFDIDHFKRYNDSHGHPAGDACLKRVAEALRQPLTCAEATRLVSPSMRAESESPSGTLARLGGEEFGLLLPGCDAGQALACAADLCERVRQLGIPHLDSPTGPCVTVSVGAASGMPSSGSEPCPLLQRADAALYRAKQQGRDRAAL